MLKVHDYLVNATNELKQTHVRHEKKSTSWKRDLSEGQHEYSHATSADQCDSVRPTNYEHPGLQVR